MSTQQKATASLRAAPSMTAAAAQMELQWRHPGIRLQGSPCYDTSTAQHPTAPLCEVRPGRKTPLLSDRAQGGGDQVDEHQQVEEKTAFCLP